MKFFKQNTVVKQQSESNQPRRFTTGQYLAAVGAMLLGITAISYAAGLLTLTQFTSGSSLSSSAVNDNFQKINDALATLTTAVNNAMPAGTLIAYSGTTVPVGFKRCPTSAGDALISRADYPALFAAIGVTWGAGNNSTTFTMPWFPEGFTLLQANAANSNIGVQTNGQVIAHSHAITHPSGYIPPDSVTSITSATGHMLTSSTSSYTESTGGAANLAAGTKVMILVKI